MPAATAAARTTGLNVEPGWRMAAVDRWTAAIAWIAPVAGSREMIAPAGSPGAYSTSDSACTTARWRRGRIVV
jgi:hypothetical protein